MKTCSGSLRNGQKKLTHMKHQLPENPSKTDGGKFPKGKSANPGGRPKGIANLVRQKTKDGGELVVIMLQIAHGKLIIQDTYRDKEGREHSVKRAPSHKDRMAAIEWLADRGFGKSTSTLEISGADSSPLKCDRILSTEELMAIASRSEQQ
ncbi:MAG: hypothetical protein ABIR24_03490 [Verrucomicrobiota bacterium]